MAQTRARRERAAEPSRPKTKPSARVVEGPLVIPPGSRFALVASRFGRPNATTSTELEAINWNDAGIGAGFALLLVLLGGGAVLATRRVGRAQTA